MAATGIGTLVGLGIFYLARLLLARDAIDPPDPSSQDHGPVADDGGSEG